MKQKVSGWIWNPNLVDNLLHNGMNLGQITTTDEILG